MSVAILTSYIIGLAYSVPMTLLLSVIFVAVIFAGFMQLRFLSVTVYKSSLASDEAGKVKEVFDFRWRCSGRVGLSEHKCPE